MVNRINKGGKEYYICEECGFAYRNNKTAKECEDYCKKYKSCSLEITKKAVKI